MNERSEENRLRRRVAATGHLLRRSRQTVGLSAGGYMIVDARGNYVVAGGHPYAYSMDLDDVEGWLNDDDGR